MGAEAVVSNDDGTRTTNTDAVVVAKIDRALAKVGFKHTNGSLTAKIDLLENYYRAKSIQSPVVGKDEKTGVERHAVGVVTCDTCGFDSVDDADVCDECPYCYEGKPAPEGEFTQGQLKAQLLHLGEEAEAVQKPTAVMLDADGLAPGVQEAAQVASAAVAAEQKPKKASSKIVKVKASDAKKAVAEKVTAEPAKEAEMAKPVDESAMVVHDADAIDAEVMTSSEKDLDDAVTLIQRLQREDMFNKWELGRALKDVYDRKLYLQRLENGKPKYKSWNQFVDAEIGYTSNYCFTLIDIAANFSRETVAKVGVGKLKLALTLSEDLREEFEAKALEGATRTELGELAQTAIERGAAPRDTGRAGFSSGKGAGAKRLDPREQQKKGTAAKEAKKAKAAQASAKGKADRPEDVISALMPRRAKVPLFKMKHDKTGKPIPATRLVDDPKGMLELHNGTKIHVRVAFNSKKQMILILETEPKS